MARKQVRDANGLMVTHYQRNKEKAKLYNLKRCYGISEDEYKKLLESQDYKCWICGKHQSYCKKGLHLDHDHKTGKIRGLLCARCNTGLGNFEDNIELMRKAIKYLEQE